MTSKLVQGLYDAGNKPEYVSFKTPNTALNGVRIYRQKNATQQALDGGCNYYVAYEDSRWRTHLLCSLC